MMRVSHNPPSFLLPCVLALLPASARAARAFGISGADAGHHPFTLRYQRGSEVLGIWQDQALYLMQSYDPEGAHTQICSVTPNKQFRFT